MGPMYVETEKPQLRPVARPPEPPRPQREDRVEQEAVKLALWRLRHGPYLRFRRGLDRAFAFVLLAISGPFLLLAALLVKLTSRGPAFYSQKRVGRDGRVYTIYKLRTMADNCEAKTGPKWSTPGDPRVTPLGRILRATHLDELPQLWNVLKGEMSLIGPRPERPEFVAKLEKTIPYYRDRLRVEPGITGLAQLQRPPDSDTNSVRRKLAYDLYYVDRVGFWLDAQILLNTAVLLFCMPFRLLLKPFRIPDVETIEDTYPELSRLADERWAA